MKIFTRIITPALMLMISAGAWAQHSVNGVPDGWNVTVDGNPVVVTQGKTPAITVGQIVRLKNNSNKTVKSMSAFNKTTIDLAGAEALGLVSRIEGDDHSNVKPLSTPTPVRKNSKDDDDEDEGRGNVSGILSTIDDAGNVKPVEWDFELDDVISTLSEKEKAFVLGVKKDFVMSLPYIYPIGDKWLWMCKTNMEYGGDMSSVPTIAANYGLTKDEVGEVMSNTVSDFVHQYRRHYLVRVSDGAVFPWPNAPEKQKGARGNFMENPDVWGIVEPYGCGDSIVYINAERQIVLLYATPGGLVEKVISPTEGEYTKAMFAAPTKDGYIGTILTDTATLSAHNCFGRGEACVLTIDGQKITIGDYDRYDVDDKGNGYVATDEEKTRMRNGKELFALNGTLYYVTRATNSNALLFSEVSIADGIASATNVKATWAHPNENEFFQCMLHQGITGITWPVFHSETGEAVWGAAEIVTFNPESSNNPLVFTERPEHYPNGQGAFYGGVAYVLDGSSYSVEGANAGEVFESSFPAKMWVCDLQKSAAEEVNIDWSGLTDDEKNVLNFEDLHWFYYGGENMFLAKGKLQSGTKVQYVIWTAGEKRGKGEILKPGDTRITGVVHLK